jgi:hypothetical protein
MKFMHNSPLVRSYVQKMSFGFVRSWTLCIAGLLTGCTEGLLALGTFGAHTGATIGAGQLSMPYCSRGFGHINKWRAARRQRRLIRFAAQRGRQRPASLASIRPELEEVAQTSFPVLDWLSIRVGNSSEIPRNPRKL